MRALHGLAPHYDAVIIGARCAGAATALLLARAGAKVLLVDRQAYGADTMSTHALMRGAVVQLAATVAMAVGFGGLGLITVFMGPMEAELGWSRSDTSLGYALSTAAMAAGGYAGGVLFDVSLSYAPSFILAGIVGVLNLAVLGAFAVRKNAAAIPVKLESRQKSADALAT